MIPVFEGPTADHVWQQLAEVFRQPAGYHVQPSRDGETKEILHAVISIADPRQRWVISRQPPLNPAFALAEVVWIMTGRRDLAFLEFWSRRFPEFVGPGPELHGAYGFRLRRHFGVDQLDRACEVLSRNPITRQVVLQIWDPKLDLPTVDGKPVDKDVPCNLASVLKIRDGKLEWLQIIRSNDLFLGVPHNLVQFTCLQEIIAGWLGVQCGSYNQISDSLHVYTRDEAHIQRSVPLELAISNEDSLALSRKESELVWEELGRRIELMITPELRQGELEQHLRWDGSQAYRNILAVLVAETARRRKWTDTAAGAMATCTNPAYREMWSRWRRRTKES